MKYRLIVVCLFIAQFMNAQTKIIAHRGFSGIAPENTMEAFKKAIETGADYFELDVHQTKDGELVVIHDNSIDRTSSDSSKGKIEEMTLEELKKVRVGYSQQFGQQYQQAGLPTLKEALTLAKGKIKVCVEIKVGGIEDEVLALINELKMKEEVIIFCFAYRVLDRINSLDSDIPLLFLVDRANTNEFEYAKVLGAKAVGAGYDTDITKELVAEAHSFGLELWRWTVNKEEDMERFMAAGLDGLITNYPDKALKIRAQLK